MRSADSLPKPLRRIAKKYLRVMDCINGLISFCQYNLTVPGDGIRISQSKMGKRISVSPTLLEVERAWDLNKGGIDADDGTGTEPANQLGGPPVTATNKITRNSAGQWVVNAGAVFDCIQVSIKDCPDGPVRTGFVLVAFND